MQKRECRELALPDEELGINYLALLVSNFNPGIKYLMTGTAETREKSPYLYLRQGLA